MSLSESQIKQYHQDGYLLVSGLIPDEVSAKAEQTLWRCLNLSPDAPETWKDAATGAQVFNDPELAACYTDEYIAAAAQLAGEDVTTFRKPGGAYTINIFPKSGEWQWPRPHIDHAIKEHGHKTFPRAFHIAAMTYLNDVEKHGGGTVVWRGSHKRLDVLARSDTEKYEYMWPLNTDINTIELGEPVEIVPKRGDVLFYHYLCAHSGSTNLSKRPRFAYNAKW